MKRNWNWFYLICIFLLIGCVGCAGNFSEKQSMEPQEDPVGDRPVASSIADEYSQILRYQLMGDILYYSGNVQQTAGQVSSLVYRSGMDKETEVIADFTEPKHLIHFVAAQDGSIYYLYCKEEEGYAVYLSRVNPQGEEEFCVQTAQADELYVGQNFEQLPEEIKEWYGIRGGEADNEGNVSFYSTYGKIFCFDTTGHLTGTLNINIEEDSAEAGIVSAGNKGSYFYYIMEDSVKFRRLDVGAGDWKGTEVTYKKESGHEKGNRQEFDRVLNDMSVYSGYEKGIFIVTADLLIQYDPLEETAEELLEWNAPEVNISGEYVSAVSVLQEGGCLALVRSTDGKTYRQIKIEEMTEEEIPSRQSVTLGAVSLGSVLDSVLKETVAGFNESNQDYQIEIRMYGIDDWSKLYLELLRGEGPDLFEMSQSFLPMDVLAVKGVLEDLGPYMENSVGLERDEFLPKVLEAGTVGGKLVCVIPAFYMSGMVVPKDAAENGCWTVEEFLELAKDYPEAALVKGVDSANVLLSNYCMVGDMPSYINWEEKTCQFNTEAFISLLEMVKSVPMKNMKNQASGSIYEQIQNKEGFFNKEYLTENININNPEDYVEAMEVLKGNGEIAGFPNGEGKPYFLLGSLMRFGMNGASERKDGAWAFLEYLLSEEYQFENTSAQSMFPIRRHAFEERLIHTMKEQFPGKYGQRSHSFTGEILTDSEFPEVTEDDREFLRYMADHVYLDNRNNLRSEYRGIISEEAAAFFAGEKTAEEAAGNIQNRVMLFLNE